jgi:septum formation protein
LIGAPLVLASSSPQRRALLERMGVAFTVRPTDVAELDRGDPAEVALENALRKARAARAHAAGVREAVLGCDTLVALGGAIYGKPADIDAARRTLEALSGATHEVVSGLALLLPAEQPPVVGGATIERTAIARTAVTFRELDGGLLDWYLARDEWRGRAGGYAIQGAGAALVRAVEGDYENVVGLPLATLLDLCPELLFACK